MSEPILGEGYISPGRVSDCFVCEDLLDTTEGVVSDTLWWRVVVSRDQGYLGRCLVVPQSHVTSEAELPLEAAIEFHYLKISFEQAVQKAFGARICNWTELGNDAFQADEPNPHLHHHVRPRYDRQPIEFDGNLFWDPTWAHMYDLHNRQNIDKDTWAPGQKQRIAEAIADFFVDPNILAIRSET